MSSAFEVSEQAAIAEFVRSGSEASFGVVFDALYQRVFTYFLVRGTERESAEDLAQEVMLVVYQKVKTLRQENLFYGWLFGIARHHLLQHREKQQRNGDMLSLDAVEGLLTGDRRPLRGLHARMDLETCLLRLTSEERELVGLRYVEGLSFAEIAEALHLPVGTMKWRMFHIRSKFAALARGTRGVLA